MPTETAGADPVYLRDPLLDATVRMLVELSAQVWVERERRLVLESWLESQGMLDRDAFERYAPDAARLDAIRSERNRFIEDIFKELRRIPLKPV